MSIELDLMEYSSDSNAQAAYVTNAPYDAYTKIVSHFDGADGATAYTDPVAGAYTFGGTAQLDTAQKKFGTASLLLDGDSDYLTLADSDNWNFGAGNFTIDFWVRWASLPSSGFHIFYDQAVDGNNEIFLFLQEISGVYKYRINVFDGASEIVDIRIDSSGLSTNTWYHIAFVRSGNTWYVFQDGVSQGSASNSATLPNLGATLYIGARSTGTQYINGWIDEFRVSKGIARWTSNFTPDDVAYPIKSGYALQSFSESTIKTQGSYALKGIGVETDSLNKTLTRTIGSPIDLSGQTQIKFDIRSNRTGGNIKIGIHDSGGTTTEKTYSISSANTYETVTWDISAVADADKNAIDSIIVTVINADATNTFYIDNMYAEAGVSFIPKIWIM